MYVSTNHALQQRSTRTAYFALLLLFKAISDEMWTNKTNILCGDDIIRNSSRKMSDMSAFQLETLEFGGQCDSCLYDPLSLH